MFSAIFLILSLRECNSKPRPKRTMRRPTSEEEQYSDEATSLRCSDTRIINSVNEDKTNPESRFAKVKRILRGTLSFKRGAISGKQSTSSSTASIVTSSSSASPIIIHGSSKTKAARKRDHSLERTIEICDDTTPRNEMCLKLTKRLDSDRTEVLRQTKPESNGNVPSPKCEKNLRKRKERQESNGVVDQERKLIRSNSEERPLYLSNKENQDLKDIRRVSSHENFKPASTTIPTKLIVETEITAKEFVEEAISIDIKIGNQLVIDKNRKDITCVIDNIPLQDINNGTQNTRNSPNKISPNRDPKNQMFSDQKFICDIDIENERRRNSERFARSFSQPIRNKHPTNKKRKTSGLKRPDFPDQSTLIKPIAPSCELCKQEQEEQNSPPPPSTPSNIDSKPPKSKSRDIDPIPLDFKTLHEQVDSSEPIPIRPNHLFTQDSENLCQPSTMSPRNSLIISRKVYMDPILPTKILNKTEMSAGLMTETSSAAQISSPFDGRIKQLNKQIKSLKKRMRSKDETGAGNSCDLSDKKIKALTLEMNKLKKELKGLKQVPPFCSKFPTSNTYANVVIEDPFLKNKRIDMISETLTEIQSRLYEKRQFGSRGDEIGVMNDDQLMDEKVAVQKALLHFETIHGRPTGKEDRDLVRPLYDRYRILKRMVARISNTKSNNSISELGTILEDETMNFVSTPIQELEAKAEDTNSINMDSSDTSDTSISENLHSLPLTELEEQLVVTREEKKRLRRAIKEYEHEFEQKNGRKLQKEDRIPFEQNYITYKQIKGKLKLLEILVSKKRHIQIES